MNWFLILVLFLSVPQSALGAEVTSKAVEPSARYTPYDMEMGTSGLKFLNGSWLYNDKNVRVMETWATNDEGDTIGIRKRLLIPGRATDEIYDVFTVDRYMRINRMNMLLTNVGKSGMLSCSSTHKNKVSIIQTDDTITNKIVPLQTINYTSPNDNELDLEIVSTDNGKETKENYKLKRMK